MKLFIALISIIIFSCKKPDANEVMSRVDSLRYINSHPSDARLILELSVMELLGKDKFDDMFYNYYKQFRSYEAYIVRDSVTGYHIDLLVLVFKKGKPLMNPEPQPNLVYSVK